MISVQVKVDEAQLRSVTKSLRNIRGALPRVMSRAINSTLVTLRSVFVKRMAQAVAMKQKDIRKRIKLLKANYKQWRGALRMYADRVPAIDLKPQNEEHGVSFEPYRGFRVTRRHAFIQTMPVSGHRGVFVREGPREKRIAPKFADLPIKEVYGPSLEDVYDSVSGLAEDNERFASETLAKRIDGLTRHELEKWQRRSSNR